MAQDDPRTALVEDGPFKGWMMSNLKGGYVNMIGPYYFKTDEDGRAYAAFQAEERHLNGGGSVHGGCLLSLADTALFIFALKHLEDSHVVTLGLESQFIAPALKGDIIIASGEVLRAGASIIFLRGQLHANERLLLHFTGTLKKIKPRQRQKPEA